MNRIIAVLVGCAALSGCATPSPVTVQVPIPVPCAIEFPPVPAIASNDELLAMNDYRLVVTLARDRLALIDYSDMLRAASQGCR